MGRKELMKRLLEARADKDRFSVWGGDELLQKFLKLKDRLPVPQNDMTYWTSGKNPHKPEELSLILNKLEQNIVKKSEEQKLIEQGAEKVFEDSNWLVYHITNFEACQKYGSGTQWCITGKNLSGDDTYGRTHWDRYTGDGNDFYFFIEKGSDVKYAVMINEINGNHTIFDPRDNEIPYIENAPEVPGLPDVSENNPVYSEDGEEEEEDGDGENIQPIQQQLPAFITFEPVTNPNELEYPATSIEDAVRKFKNSELVDSLGNNLYLIKFDENKYTILAFDGQLGGPLLQQSPNGFVLITSTDLERFRNFLNQNIANIRVQRQNEAGQPVNEEQTKKSDFKTPEELASALLNLGSNEVWYWGTQQPGKKHGAFGKGLPTLETYWKKVSKEPNTTIDKEVVRGLLDELKKENWWWWNYTKDDGKGNQSYFTTHAGKFVELSLKNYLSAYEQAIAKGVTLNDLKQKKVTFLFPRIKTKWEGPFSDINITGKEQPTDTKQPQNPESGDINNAKLDKEVKKGDDIMEKQVKPMEEKQDKGEQKNLQAYVTAVANLVDFLFHDYGAPWEQIHGLLQSAGLSDEEIAEYNLSDLEEAKKPVMESKKPIKEGVRLVYNPREKKTVKEEVKLSFDGEPLPVDIKESNTHTKLRLFKHK